MNTPMKAQASITEAVKTRTLEQVVAAGRSGAFAGDDLYWILYRAATEASDTNAFYFGIINLLDQALGQNAYIFAWTISKNGYGGFIDNTNPRLPNGIQWGGDAGVLPGVASAYAVSVFVFWGG
ncbi:hypothetical protein WMF11_46375 [Sorangium sp. So ce295]|uniref:hypothetical protein n=1 Tax=Sorangium sp. So ce295 TaxID=3133295 RepID=UPI003F61D1D7